MMTFDELLQKSKDGIVDRWLKAALSVYPEEGSGSFLRQKDPFANPVGHRLRTGLRQIFETLLGGTDGGTIRHHLHEILSIRAVQDLSVYQAAGFVFELKGAIREEMGDAATDPAFASELYGVDGKIDQIALVAFDVFVECREKLSELRVNEVKRQVSWIMGKMNANGPDPESAPTDGDVTLPGETEV